MDIDGFDIDYGVRNYCVVFVVARSLKDIEFFFFLLDSCLHFSEPGFNCKAWEFRNLCVEQTNAK